MERKTAFHVAVQHYCQQLGIICHESPLPIAIRSSTDGLSPSSSLFDPPEDDISVPVPDSDSEMVSNSEQTKLEPNITEPVMGFRPPASTRAKGLKARKSKSRKTVLRAAT